MFCFDKRFYLHDYNMLLVKHGNQIPAHELYLEMFMKGIFVYMQEQEGVG